MWYKKLTWHHDGLQRGRTFSLHAQLVSLLNVANWTPLSCWYNKVTKSNRIKAENWKLSCYFSSDTGILMSCAMLPLSCKRPTSFTSLTVHSQPTVSICRSRRWHGKTGLARPSFPGRGIRVKRRGESASVPIRWVLLSMRGYHNNSEMMRQWIVEGLQVTNVSQFHCKRSRETQKKTTTNFKG